jgi:hypothetical protein
VFGPHNLTAPHSHNYAASLAVTAAGQLTGEHHPEAWILDALYLLDVKHVLFLAPGGYVLPATRPDPRSPGAAGVAVDDRLPGVVVRDASPVVFAPRLVAVDPRQLAAYEARLLWDTRDGPYARAIAATAQFVRDAVIAPMGLNRERGVADAVVVRGAAPSNQQEARLADFRLLDFEVRETALRASIRSATAGYLQFAYAFYPLLDVRVDGRAVTPIEGAMSLLVVAVPAGAHEVQVRARLSGLRLATLAIFAVGVVVLWLVAAWPRRPADRRATEARSLRTR